MIFLEVITLGVCVAALVRSMSLQRKVRASLDEIEAAVVSIGQQVADIQEGR